MILISNKPTKENRQKFPGKWWELAEPVPRDQFTEEARKMTQQIVRAGMQDWRTVTEDLRQLSEKLLGKHLENEAGKGDLVVERVYSGKLSNKETGLDNPYQV